MTENILSFAKKSDGFIVLGEEIPCVFYDLSKSPYLFLKSKGIGPLSSHIEISKHSQIFWNQLNSYSDLKFFFVLFDLVLF